MRGDGISVAEAEIPVDDSEAPEADRVAGTESPTEMLTSWPPRERRLLASCRTHVARVNRPNRRGTR